MRKSTKWSPIWRMPSDEFSQLVAKSHSSSEVLRHFGFNRSSHRTLKSRISAERISTAHFVINYPPIQKAASLSDIMTVNSSYSRGHLKTRLIREGLLKEECFKCGCGTSWCGEPLVLILDHINGVNNDHRLDNLRLVCPNCNSQLSTFAGRNGRGKFVSATPNSARRSCLDCGKQLSEKKSERCKQCSNTHKGVQRRVIDWPSYEALQQRISQSNRSVVARELGVSETAVRKMLKRMQY